MKKQLEKKYPKMVRLTCSLLDTPMNRKVLEDTLEDLKNKKVQAPFGFLRIERIRFEHVLTTTNPPKKND